ncbi:hypothetical protein [Nonomuraea harbinensis]|uniref:Apea-like HEPN domain-containing protein n=1 Tax=Nonomuraea harbinensis TaxID=1286938 RepID=A0ABW1C562_9ACTN|nr:hypothetical protein [Nonomuraea harbinensis]
MPTVKDVAPNGLLGKEWHSISINHLIAGDPTAVHRLVFHVASELTHFPLPDCHTDEGVQGQLEFALPGWHLRMARIEPSPISGPATIVEATPDHPSPTGEMIDVLGDQLFDLLGLIAGTEPGVDPTVGLSESDEIVWVHWGVPRSGQASWRWCEPEMVESVLPILAHGFTGLVQDVATQKIVSRAIRYWMAANARGVVLDVKIPVACSGLELLAWTVLQQRGWLTAESVNKLNVAANLRLLLYSMDIPVALPAGFDALAKRNGAYHGGTAKGPELIFAVRNDLVHPAKKAAKLEWPSSPELTEAWRLSMWYLELVILRLLDYQGGHLSRLKHGAFSIDSVPWAS